MANEPLPPPPLTSAAATTTSIKHQQQQQNPRQPEDRRPRSVFEVPADYFDSCRLLQSPSSSLPFDGLSIHDPDDAVQVQSQTEQQSVYDNNASSSNSGGVVMRRWSCNMCKAEFESLEDQRSHFKSDIHRFNIKLSVAGKDTIKEEDLDETTSDSLCKDFDISSISGSEDEDDKQSGLIYDARHGSDASLKNKIFIQLLTGERISIWKCLLLEESENIAFGSDKSVARDDTQPYWTEREVTEKLKHLIREPRDGTCLRVVLLARGGHFAGCVFDGNSVVAHKTFHRYVIRAKAGKRQSSKDAGGKTIHSAGASLRRYNELALKKEIQELLAAWKPYFAASSSIFLYAPSNNRQVFFDGDKPSFICQHRAIRSVPLTVRRPTFREARRIYNVLTQISSEVYEETMPIMKEKSTNSSISTKPYHKSSQADLSGKMDSKEVVGACSSVKEIGGVSIPSEDESDDDGVHRSTPLHEAAKSGNAQKVLELLEQGLSPCDIDQRGRTPYMLASDKEVRNTFRRFMASNTDKWDWHAAKVPSALTKEMEESQAAKQAEKEAKRKARAKELKKLRKAREKKAQAEAAESQKASVSALKGQSQSSGAPKMSKEEEIKRAQEAEREKRAAAAERRMAAATAAAKAQDSVSSAASSSSQSTRTTSTDVICSCCQASLAGMVPFHRYNYKYCSTSCMHVHREILEDG